MAWASYTIISRRLSPWKRIKVLYFLILWSFPSILKTLFSCNFQVFCDGLLYKNDELYKNIFASEYRSNWWQQIMILFQRPGYLIFHVIKSNQIKKKDYFSYRQACFLRWPRTHCVAEHGWHCLMFLHLLFKWRGYKSANNSRWIFLKEIFMNTKYLYSNSHLFLEINELIYLSIFLYFFCYAFMNTCFYFKNLDNNTY